MADSTPALLNPWSSYYVMTGSSAAALTGLMFVVITLVRRAERAMAIDGIATFSTPTVLHFCTALFISAVMTAPWHTLVAPSILIGAGGLLGVIYLVRIMLRMLSFRRYSADIEDWIWYDVVPFFAYVVMFAGAVALHVMPVGALFTLAGVVLAFLFVGIRNSWDVVTYIATGQADPDPPE